VVICAQVVLGTTVSSTIVLREISRFLPFYYSYSRPLREVRCFWGDGDGNGATGNGATGYGATGYDDNDEDGDRRRRQRRR
jgi:hypothetical protein